MGIGIYRDDNGNPIIMDVVRRAEKLVVEQKTENEYSPLDGNQEFNLGARGVLFG